jgi:hypothetical protein
MNNIDLQKNISTYITLDPIFRVNARFYKIYSLIVDQMKLSITISKLNSSFYGLAFLGFLSFITYLIQNFGMTLRSLPWVLLLL